MTHPERIILPEEEARSTLCPACYRAWNRNTWQVYLCTPCMGKIGERVINPRDDDATESKTEQG